MFKDWQIGTLLSYSSGLPIPVPASTSSISNQLFQGALDDRVQGVPLYLVPSLNCHCFDPSTTAVLNPAAWTAPAPGQFGTAAPFYSDFRYARHPNENINLGRTWRIKERMSLNLRVEFSNFLNRTFLNNPAATSPTNPTTPVTLNQAGLLTGGLGYITTAFSSTNHSGAAAQWRYCRALYVLTSVCGSSLDPAVSNAAGSLFVTTPELTFCNRIPSPLLQRKIERHTEISLLHLTKGVQI